MPLVQSVRRLLNAVGPVSREVVGVPLVPVQ